VSQRALEEAMIGLTRAVAELAKRLPLGADADAKMDIKLTTFSTGPSVAVPMTVPEALQRRFPQPRHMSILTRLVRAGRIPLDELVRRAIGVADRRIVDGIKRLNGILAAAHRE
jgi:hypothetical protein